MINPKYQPLTALYNNYNMEHPRLNSTLRIPRINSNLHGIERI